MPILCAFYTSVSWICMTISNFAPKTWNFTLKRPLCWTTFLLNIVRLWSWNLYTVELRWLEFEGTVKICSSYRKFEPLRSCNFREKIIRFWPRTVSLRYYNWCTVKKIFNPLESSQRLWLLNTSLVSSNFHFVRDLFYKQEIRGRVLTLGSISV